MKHVLKFVLRTLIVIGFSIIVFVRFLWSFKVNDKFKMFPRGLFHTFKNVVWKEFDYEIGISRTYRQLKTYNQSQKLSSTY